MADKPHVTEQAQFQVIEGGARSLQEEQRDAIAEIARTVREAFRIAREGRPVIVDFKRAAYADRTAIALICQTALVLSSGDCTIVFTELSGKEELQGLKSALEERVGSSPRVRLVSDTDLAIELFEDEILAETDFSLYDRILPLAEIDIFDGLSKDDLQRLSGVATTFQYAAGDKIISEGDDARVFFVVARGSVSVSARAVRVAIALSSSSNPGAGPVGPNNGAAKGASAVWRRSAMLRSSCIVLSMDLHNPASLPADPCNSDGSSAPSSIASRT